MRAFTYVVLALFVAAIYVYFFGTPLAVQITGFSPRAISLSAGFAVAVLGFAVMMLGKLAAQRGQNKQ
jgi:hypothetical protein